MFAKIGNLTSSIISSEKNLPLPMTAVLIFKKLSKQFQGNSEQFVNAQITRCDKIIASYSACHSLSLIHTLQGFEKNAVCQYRCWKSKFPPEGMWVYF